jgi:hypothetical protein
MHGSDGHSLGGGHDHGHGYGIGHDKGFAHGVFDHNFHDGHNGFTTADAIVVGYVFGNFALGHSTGQVGHIDTSIAGSHPGGFSGSTGAVEGNGPSFDGPVNLDQIHMAVLGVGMSQVDFDGNLRASAARLGLAECRNLMLANKLIVPPRRYDSLLPVNFKEAPAVVTDPQMPKLFYPEATGFTTISRTNWQLGERTFFDKLRGIPAHRVNGVRTYMEVETTIWFYAEPHDYEIRFVVNVIGGRDPNELHGHLVAARGLCGDMLKAFKNAPPSSESLAIRQKLAR